MDKDIKLILALLALMLFATIAIEVILPIFLSIIAVYLALKIIVLFKEQDEE